MSILKELLQEADSVKNSSDTDAVDAACNFVQALIDKADTYRKLPAAIENTDDAAASPEDIPRLMGHLGDQIMCSRYTVHPIEMAAMACKRLTDIQPFDADNHTLAVELMNLILTNSGYPAIAITDTNLPDYQQAMTATRIQRDMEPFSCFVAKQVIDAAKTLK